MYSGAALSLFRVLPASRLFHQQAVR